MASSSDSRKRVRGFNAADDAKGNDKGFLPSKCKKMHLGNKFYLAQKTLTRRQIAGNIFHRLI